MSKSFIKINKLNIGYYLYSFTEKDMYIHNLEIDINQRGKGYFKILIEHIKQTAINNNCSSITLQPEYQGDISIFDTSKKLRELYKRHGFNLIDYNNNFMRLII